MNALIEAAGVRSMFVGHDHGNFFLSFYETLIHANKSPSLCAGNSWCCPYNGIEICYNRHTGYGAYGEWTRGARVISLDFNNLANQTNYVRLETGEITDEFTPKQ